MPNKILSTAEYNHKHKHNHSNAQSSAQFNTKQAQLLTVLSDNQFHSGQALAEQFNSSRATVSNWIQKLRDSGVAIHSVSGKGYCFAEYVRPINVDQLKVALNSVVSSTVDSAQKNASIQLNYQPQTDSTNEVIKRLLKLEPPNPAHILFSTTEKQTAGRGRRGRQWHSPYAQNCYFSVGRQFNLALTELSGLSLVVGIAIAEALTELNYPIQLKWPNDLYLNGKKLGGILVELEGAFESPCHVIIGVGINVNMPSIEVESNQIDQAWISLSQYKGEVINRTELLAIITPKILMFLSVFEQQGFKKISELWAQYDCYFNQAVNIISVDKTTTGIAKGINTRGELILQTTQGEKIISGGEISLRPVQ